MERKLPTGGMRKNLAWGLRHSIRRFITTRGIGKIGKNVYIGQNVKLMRNPQRIFLGDDVVLNDYVILCPTYEKATIEIKERSVLNYYTMVFASSTIKIGKDSIIGPFVYIGDSNHGFKGKGPISKQDIIVEPITIGNGVWIGAGSKILKGVKIGDNSVIGAGSVVTENIPPHKVACGVPARVIKDI